MFENYIWWSKNENTSQEFAHTVSEADSKHWSEFVAVCACVCAGWWSTASCQRHRDTTLIGTHGASVHH